MKFDTKAIIAGEIPNMKSAIEKYTQNVETEISRISSYQVNTGDGFYGAAQIQKVDEYINKTCEEIGKIVRYFDEFQAALDQVEAAYDAQQANINVSEVQAHKEADPEGLIKVNRME